MKFLFAGKEYDTKTMSNKDLIRWIVNVARSELSEQEEVLAIAQEIESRWVGGGEE